MVTSCCALSARRDWVGSWVNGIGWSRASKACQVTPLPLLANDWMLLTSTVALARKGWLGSRTRLRNGVVATLGIPAVSGVNGGLTRAGSLVVGVGWASVPIDGKPPSLRSLLRKKAWAS